MNVIRKLQKILLGVAVAVSVFAVLFHSEVARYLWYKHDSQGLLVLAGAYALLGFFWFWWFFLRRGRQTEREFYHVLAFWVLCFAPWLWAGLDVFSYFVITH